MNDIVDLSRSELDLVNGGGGFWQSVGWAYDNPGEAIGFALDHLDYGGQKGYYANGVYNIK